MAVDRLIGVDFGTSTSVIRVKRYENGKPIGEKLETKEVVFGGSGAMVPTLIMKKDDDASVCYFGYEAQQKKKKFTNFHSFKMELESSDPAKRAQARQLTEEFYAYLAKQYKSQSDGGHLGTPDDKERTIISYPVKWSEETKNFMLETAKKAGFPNVTGMDEAQAAIQAVIVMSTNHLQKHDLLKNGVGTNILLIDMGAGTTDLVLTRYMPGDEPKTEVLNTWPKSGDIQFGGREIDNLLQNFFRDLLDEDDAEMVFRRIGSDKFKSWKEETVSPALHKRDSVSDFEVLDSCVDMMGVDLEDYCLDRAALEKCLADYLKQFPELINGCLQNAGMSGSDVDLVIVTGGHSQWYFVNEMLSGMMPQFGNLDLPKIRENPARIVPISRPQETVALGLAYSGIRSNSSGSVKPLTDTVAEPVFAMEIKQVFPVSGVTAVSGTVSLGEVKIADTVYVYNRAGKVLEGQVKNIANPGAGTSFQNGTVAAKGNLAVLGLEGIKLEELSENMILFKQTNGYAHVPLAKLTKIIQNGEAQEDDEKKKADEQKRSTEPLDQKRREQEQQEQRQKEQQEQREKEHYEQQDRARVLEEVRRRAAAMQVDPKDLPYTPESEFEIGSVGGNDCSISKYLGNSTVVKIPPTIRGRKVVAIGAMAFSGITIFSGSKSIETVIIPETVKKIGFKAFQSCSSLKVVIAHKNIESIGAQAFCGCKSLRKMDFGMGECEEGNVIFPPMLKSIGSQAFYKNDLVNPTACIFTEVMMSKRTKVHNLPGFKVFTPNSCAVFYYD